MGLDQFFKTQLKHPKQSRSEAELIMAVYFYEQPIFAMERSILPPTGFLQALQLRPSQHFCAQKLENYLDLMDQILDKAEIEILGEGDQKHSKVDTEVETEDDTETDNEVEIAIDTNSDKVKKTMTQVKV